MNIAVRGNIRRMGIFGYTILIIIINKIDITTPHDILYSAIPSFLCGLSFTGNPLRGDSANLFISAVIPHPRSVMLCSLVQ